MASASEKGRSTRRVLPLVRRVTWRPLGGLLGPAARDAAQSLIAIGVAIVATLAAGLVLSSVEQTLIDNQGLLLLFPAAIGLRGNVFGPFVSRLSTSMRAGTFGWSTKRDSLLVQNIMSVVAMSFFASICVGLIAKLTAEISIDSDQVMTTADFVTVAIVSAAIATVGLLAVTLGLAIVSTKLSWDLDNVTAPVVTAAGDLITLPALLIGVSVASSNVGAISTNIVGWLITAGSLVVIFWTKSKISQRIVVESVPVLLLAGCVSLLAGIVIEGSIESLRRFSVFLVLLPAYLAVAGSLGGILSNRLSTKLHLGLVSPSALPRDAARSDMAFTFRIAIPIFLILAICSQLLAEVFDRTAPGAAQLLGIVLTGGMVATCFVAAVAYYGTIMVVRFGLNPDNHGIPIVTASLDLVGSFTLIASVWLWGI